MSADTTSTDQTPTEEKHQCPKCLEVFLSRQGLAVHLVRIHGDPMKRKQWAANIARGNRAVIKQKRRQLKDAVRKPFTCEECGKLFETVQAKGLHMFRAHPTAAQRKKKKVAWNAGLTTGPKRRYIKKAVRNGVPEAAAAAAVAAVVATAGPISALRFCPQCGFDQRALQVAMNLKVNKQGLAE